MNKKSVKTNFKDNSDTSSSNLVFTGYILRKGTGTSSTNIQVYGHNEKYKFTVVVPGCT